jgi:hypothetical protein
VRGLNAACRGGAGGAGGTGERGPASPPTWSTAGLGAAPPDSNNSRCSRRSRLRRRKRFLHAVQPIAQSVKAPPQCRTLRFRQASPITNAAKVCNVLRRTSDLIPSASMAATIRVVFLSTMSAWRISRRMWAEIPRGCTASNTCNNSELEMMSLLQPPPPPAPAPPLPRRQQ